MRLLKLIKEFRFSEDVRAKITLGTDVRLNPDEHWLQLKAGSDGYPLTSDLYAKTWVSNPESVKQWIGFEAEVLHTKVNTVQVTSVGYQISDGTTDRYWSGAAWVAAGASDWNTEEEVAANIGTYPVTERKLQVILNLKTTDKVATPKVLAIKVLYASAIEFQEDIIYRSLVPALRDGVRPRARVPFTAATTTDTFDLDDLGIETPYNIVDVDAVFNDTDDPNHLTDLLDTYTPSTKVITLTSTIAQGKTVWVDFLWEPEVAVTTSQDYSEVEKVPAIVLDDINLVDASVRGQKESVVNRNDGTAVTLQRPLVGDLEILMHLLTDKGVDLQRLATEVKRFFANNPLLRSVGTDEEYRLWVLDEFDMTTAANRGDIHTGRLRFSIVGVRYYLRDAVDGYGIKKFHLTGDMDVIVPP